VSADLAAAAIADELRQRFDGAILAEQHTRDGIPTLWVKPDRAKEIVRHLKAGVDRPYRLLYDLTAVDERVRSDRAMNPASDFTVVYHLLSFDRNADIRIKAPLVGERPSIETITDVYPNANWYEREVWDMFGVTFSGHPYLRRILMPTTWKGHPLRKEHPARATELEPFDLPDDELVAAQEALKFRPEDWGLERSRGDTDYMFLNLGPHHPGTHGLLRVILQLEGEVIVNSVPDIGYHHRGAEKMGERQTWHSFIPYTDRIDYVAGVLNNLAYLLGVEQLAGIAVPPRAQMIRVMMSEFFRIASHLVWYGTFAQDLGAMSPVFYMFNDRERVFEIVEAICGGRMHPAWFRIGGVAHDLPRGWDKMVRDFIAYFPPKLLEYDKALIANRIFINRVKGIGKYTLDEAIDWGVTGPGLRACGFEWDLRKKRPYSGYDQFEFEVPIRHNGDCLDRGLVHIEEMRQSVRIIEQCLNNMPEGPYKADHPLTTPPRKERTMHDIETLINHFLGVSWGPVIPNGEAFSGIEGAKGGYGYYLISDGNTMSYRTRIRTPSFAHLQMIPLMSRGVLLSDLLAILGSIDFVLADVDR